MTKIIFVLIMSILSQIINHFRSGSEKLKRLGYKLLIVHADDMGLSHSANLACTKALEIGTVTSASIMMPCLGAKEAIDLSNQNKNTDFGIHLTLTSEWPNYRWSPVLGKKVSSLTDSEGFFFKTCEELEKRAKISEVESEWRAQIELALSQGMRPTHLDCHMFSGTINREFLSVYVRLGRTYELPVQLYRKKLRKLTHYYLNSCVSDNETLIDRLYIATPRQVKDGQTANFYKNVLLNLEPGINCLLVHPAYDNCEMKMITQGMVDYNSKWRQADLDFLTNEECREIIQGKDIILTDWRKLSQYL